MTANIADAVQAEREAIAQDYEQKAQEWAAEQRDARSENRDEDANEARFMAHLFNSLAAQVRERK